MTEGVRGFQIVKFRKTVEKMDSTFITSLYESIMTVNTVKLRHNEARTALDKCASYLNVSMRVIESYIRQVKENPCPLMCDKISETADKVTSVAAIQQEVFKVYLDGWEDEDTIQILTRENADPAATKLSTEATMKDWFTRCSRVTTDASKAVKTAWNSLGPSTAREDRWRRRQGVSPSDGRHSGDPPDQKINLALELKPEMISTDTDHLTLLSWKDQALTYAQASKLDKQDKTIQTAYLRPLVTPEFWQEVLITAEYSGIDVKELTFATGLDLVETTFLRNNNQYLLQLKTLSAKFSGKTARDFLTWFYNFKKQASACRVFDLSARQLLCLWGLKELPQSIQAKVLEAHNKPELDEMISVVENLATVEAMTDKKKSVINNINDMEDKPQKKEVKCYRCSESHYRSQCTVPKVFCDTCSSSTHSNAACGLINRDRDKQSKQDNRESSRERSSSRASSIRDKPTSPSSSSETSSTDEETQRRRRRREEKRRDRSKEKRKKKDKKKDKPRLRRNSSSTAVTSARSSSRSTSRGRKVESRNKGRGKEAKRKNTPAPKRKKRGSVNAIENGKRSITAKTDVCCMVKNEDDMKDKAKEFVIKSVLDTGCGKFLVRTEICHQNNWNVKRLLPSQIPELCNPDGSPLQVAGYVNIWLKLPGEVKHRKHRAHVVDNLQNKMLIGLPVLQKNRWIPKGWPENIAESKWRWAASSSSSSSEDEDSEEEAGGRFTVNAVAEWHEKGAKERRSRDMKRRSRHKMTTAPLIEEEEPTTADETTDFSDKEEPGQEEELEYLNALLERTDYKQIPGFDTLPEELKEAVMDYKAQFSNTMKRGDAMKVKPAKFKLKKNYKVPEQRGGVQLPPIHMRPACDKLMDELEEAEVIEPSPPDDSEFASRAIFLAKHGDVTKIRLAIDYLRSGVNEALVRAPHPQPTPEQLVTNIPSGMHHMAVVDIKHCYFMYPVAKDEDCGPGEVGRSISKFVTYRGSYRLTALGQGMKTSSDWISYTLGALQQEPELKMSQTEGGIERCVDDCLLVAPDFPTFMRKFRMLMSKCQQYGVYLNPQKFVYSTEKVQFGGFIVTPQGITQDPSRLLGVKQFKRPERAADVRRFLGLCNSLSKYTNVLLRSTTHLRALTKAHAPFIWNDQAEKEFLYLKDQMSQPKLLHHFRPGMQLGADIDSSDAGWGGLLYFYDKELSEEPQEGNFYLLAAYSGAAPDSWRNFSTTEKEAAGTLNFIRKAHFYTAGTRVRARTDHKPWMQAYNGQDLLQCPTRLKRIMLEMRDYDVQMVYAPAEVLACADSLSRAPASEVAGDDPLEMLHQERIKHGLMSNNCVNNVIDQQDVLYNINDALYSDLFRHCQESQVYQEAVQEARKDNTNRNWKDLPKGCFARSLQDNWARTSVISNSRGENMMVIDGERCIIPESFVPCVLKMVDVAHVGSKKAIALCKNKFYWKGYQEDIIRHCQNCHTCRQHQQNYPTESFTAALDEQLPKRPFATISADEFQDGNDHYLMIGCRFSGFSRYCKFGQRRTSAKIIEMLKQWSLDYSWPECLMTDGPPVMISKEVETWLKDNKISHTVSSPHNPQSNGFIESKVKLWKNIKDRLVTDGRYSPGEMQQAWAVAMDFPSEVGELPPSRLALMQDRRNPQLPVLPAEPGDEVDAGQQMRQVRERRKMERNERKAKHLRKPPDLEVGMRILVKDDDGVFRLPAKILSIRPESQKRTAVVEFPDGSTKIRNRRFFIEDKTQPQINDMVGNVISNDDFYFRLERESSEEEECDEKGQYEKGGDFVVKKIVLTNELTSCMKQPGVARRRRAVTFADK